MTPKQFIEKAIEGGRYESAISVKTNRDGNLVTIKYRDHEWDGTTTWTKQEYIHKILLDPKAWQAVGKVEGWRPAGEHGMVQEEEIPEFYMHHMIDALCEGRTIEQFLEAL